MSPSPKDTVAYWRGTVDQRLDNIDEKVSVVCRKIDRVEEKVDTLIDTQQNGDRFITWQFLREKFTVPIIVAAITFFLFSVMPTIFVVIYLVVGNTP